MDAFSATPGRETTAKFRRVDLGERILHVNGTYRAGYTRAKVSWSGVATAHQSNKSEWVPVRTRMRVSFSCSQTNNQSGSM